MPEVTVMLGDGRRETSTKHFFIEVKAYRSVQATKEPEPILIAAYGVKDLAPAADGSWDGAVRQRGQGLQQDALQAPEEKRRESRIATKSSNFKNFKVSRPS